MPRLTLARHEGESITIDGVIVATVAEVRGRRVVLVIEAPEDVAIMRTELLDPPGGEPKRPPANPQLRRRR